MRAVDRRHLCLAKLQKGKVISVEASGFLLAWPGLAWRHGQRARVFMSVFVAPFRLSVTGGYVRSRRVCYERAFLSRSQ